MKRWYEDLKAVPDLNMVTISKLTHARLIAIEEAFGDGMCMAVFPCDEQYRPEDDSYGPTIHDKTCPYSDKWEGP